MAGRVVGGVVRRGGEERRGLGKEEGDELTVVVYHSKFAVPVHCWVLGWLPPPRAGY